MTIAGGGSTTAPNRVEANFATVGGGFGNYAFGRGTVGGGERNSVAIYAVVGGGLRNTGENLGTVGGGRDNTAGYLGTVGGGGDNTAGSGATVGGGLGNEAAGDWATVPGGRDCDAGGEYSFAAGRRAKAEHTGAFVWADSTEENFASERADQFRVRANGGARFDVNNNHWIDFRYWQGSPHHWTIISTSTGAYLTAGGAWTNASDAGAKEHLAPVDGQQVLRRLAALPVLTWNYSAEDASVRHIGPTAQDFRAVFGYGGDETAIATVDADGVALAAIQGLYELVQQQNEELAAKDERLAGQEAEIEALEARLGALEAMVRELAGEGAGGAP